MGRTTHKNNIIIAAALLMILALYLLPAEHISAKIIIDNSAGAALPGNESQHKENNYLLREYLNFDAIKQYMPKSFLTLINDLGKIQDKLLNIDGLDTGKIKSMSFYDFIRYASNNFGDLIIYIMKIAKIAVEWLNWALINIINVLINIISGIVSRINEGKGVLMQ